MNIQTNAPQLVSISVMGQIVSPAQPALPAQPYSLDSEGHSFLLPYYGGIVYNVSVGQSAYGWLADCIHPGISISTSDASGNRALNVMSCVGNVATVTNGDAKGAQGVVTGKSGRFSDQVIIHFDRATRDKLAVGDKITIQAKGIGLALPNHPGVRLKSCSSELIEAMNLSTAEDGKLAVPVVGIVPAHLLGAGSGLISEGGSIHIQTGDKVALTEAGLDQLRLGDIVALADYDGTWNHGYLHGAYGIGVVGQGDSPRAGYGPGVTLLMTAADGSIQPVITDSVNLADLLGLTV